MTVILVLGTVINDALEYPEETCQNLIDEVCLCLLVSTV